MNRHKERRWSLAVLLLPAWLVFARVAAPAQAEEPWRPETARLVGKALAVMEASDEGAEGVALGSGAAAGVTPAFAVAYARVDPLASIAETNVVPTTSALGGGGWAPRLRFRWQWGPSNMLWQVSHRPLQVFNATYAKQWYGQQSDLALKSANPNSRWSVLTHRMKATMFDVVGGYIGGEPATRRQAYWQGAWSLVPVVKLARSFGGVFINIAEGNKLGAALDALSLVHGQAHIKANAFEKISIQADTLKANAGKMGLYQYTSKFSDVAFDRLLKSFDYRIPDITLGTVGHLRSASTILRWESGLAPGSGALLSPGGRLGDLRLNRNDLSSLPGSLNMPSFSTMGPASPTFGSFSSPRLSTMANRGVFVGGYMNPVKVPSFSTNVGNVGSAHSWSPSIPSIKTRTVTGTKFK